MSVFAQHGAQKSDKIQNGLRDGLISGAILSPRYESPARLGEFLEEITREFTSAEFMIDPQFWASSISPVQVGHLPEYEYFQEGLTRAKFSATNIATIVRDTLNYQNSLPVSFLVSPTILINDFDDAMSQIAFLLAEESSSYINTIEKSPPLLISIMFSEHALAADDHLNVFLDMVSQLDVRGFYIIMNRNTMEYNAKMDPNNLTNLLYLTYSLAELNDYHVVFGYTDLIGVLLHAVGAETSACGWHSSLRKFSTLRFNPQGGGRPARPRYTSIPLINSILQIPELITIDNVGALNDVLTNTNYDTILGRNSNENWALPLSTLHHWASLSMITDAVLGAGTISSRLNYMSDRISTAQALYQNLVSRGVLFDTNSNLDHLAQWTEAIRTFRDKVGV